MAFFRVGRDVLDLGQKVGLIANPVLVESGLPHLAAEVFFELVREPALDALGASFNGLIRSGR